MLLKKNWIILLFLIINCQKQSSTTPSPIEKPITTKLFENLIIKGYAFKGPFIIDSPVNIEIFNSDHTLLQTIKTKTRNSLGYFEVTAKVNSIKNTYLKINVQGKTYSEFLGEFSSDKISLSAYVNSEETWHSVGIISHITHQRIEHLLNNNIPVNKAIEQATNEFISELPFIQFGDFNMQNSSFNAEGTKNLIPHFIFGTLMNAIGAQDGINTLTEDFVDGHFLVDSKKLLNTELLKIDFIKTINNFNIYFSNLGFSNSLPHINHLVDSDNDGLFNEEDPCPLKPFVGIETLDTNPECFQYCSFDYKCEGNTKSRCFATSSGFYTSLPQICEFGCDDKRKFHITHESINEKSNAQCIPYAETFVEPGIQLCENDKIYYSYLFDELYSVLSEGFSCECSEKNCNTCVNKVSMVFESSLDTFQKYGQEYHNIISKQMDNKILQNNVDLNMSISPETYFSRNKIINESTPLDKFLEDSQNGIGHENVSLFSNIEILLQDNYKDLVFDDFKAQFRTAPHLNTHKMILVFHSIPYWPEWTSELISSLHRYGLKTHIVYFGEPLNTENTYTINMMATLGGTQAHVIDFSELNTTLENINNNFEMCE